MRFTHLACVSALFLATIPFVAIAEDFTVEDEQLTAPPKMIEDAIRNRQKLEYPMCKLIGKSIDLTGQGADSGFVATTADACGWGAAQGPIWVVLNGTKPTTVLEYGGYSVTLGRQLQNGLRNVAISAATAGRSSESLWKFDGVRYAKIKETVRLNR